ncbi:UDP-N-acetylmuramoylalanyl-D-glutamyl-2, 6-diaminopimelate--D-alanyl-D-alanine ligase, partial [Microvirga sp. 3-52]|nr:UDP-N-acetylmuramoylalanyl-D-glutamyl-2, 6-diaminopimelate--D-alanyl-D-alanine ligase [Microvirga sp. 3-52]
MDTKELLSILPIKKIEGALPPAISDLAVNSRAINAGGMFVCIIGFTVDGHDFVQQAVANGARVIVASKPVD